MNKPYLIFEPLITVINSDLDFYGHLLNDNLIHKIVEMLTEKSKQAILQQSGIDEQKAEVILHFAITGMIEVFRQWYHSRQTQSIEALSETIGIMVFQGMNGILNEYDC